MNAVFAAIVALCEKHRAVRLSFVHAPQEPGAPVVLGVSLEIEHKGERYAEAFDVTLIGPTEAAVLAVQERILLLAKRAERWRA